MIPLSIESLTRPQCFFIALLYGEKSRMSGRKCRRNENISGKRINLAGIKNRLKPNGTIRQIVEIKSKRAPNLALVLKFTELSRLKGK
jgi:hypothetical protein